MEFLLELEFRIKKKKEKYGFCRNDEFDHNYDVSRQFCDFSISRDRSLQSRNSHFNGINPRAKVLRADGASLARKLPPRHLRAEIDSRQDKPR